MTLLMSSIFIIVIILFLSEIISQVLVLSEVVKKGMFRSTPGVRQNQNIRIGLYLFGEVGQKVSKIHILPSLWIFYT